MLFTYKATKEGPSTGGGSTNDYNPFQYGWMRMTTLAVKRRQQTAHKNS
jgi:hypothetical protein